MPSNYLTTYSVDSDKRFEKALERARAEIKDLSPALKDISDDFYQSQESLFSLKTRGRYPDLKPKTKLRKEAMVGFVYPILKFSGALADSTLAPNAPGSVLVITKETVVIGSSIPYGVFHQAGTKHLPVRKFIFSSDKQFDTEETKGRVGRWLNILNNFVLAKMSELGETSGVKGK